MSKGLEALKEHIINLKSLGFTRCEEWLGLIVIEKELKALEIIKKYHITAAFFMFNSTYKSYEVNMSFYEDEQTMSEEEYNLAKEVLL